MQLIMVVENFAHACCEPVKHGLEKTVQCMQKRSVQLCNVRMVIARGFVSTELDSKFYCLRQCTSDSEEDLCDPHLW